MDLQMESSGVEVDWDRAKVVHSGEYDGDRPRSDGNARVVETNAQHRDNQPGGHGGERGVSGGIEGGRERQSDGNRVEMGGRRCRMDGATSNAHHDLKRVGTTMLADSEDQASQYEERKRNTTHVPRPSTPPPINHIHPADQPNPPRRRGQLKSRPRNISNPRWTYQATWTCRSRIRRIGCVRYVVYSQEMVQE